MMSEALSFLPWWISLPLLAGGCILALIVGLAAFNALVFVAQQVWDGSWRLADSLAVLFARVMVAAFAGCVALLKVLVSLLLWPLTVLWEYTAVRAYETLVLKAEVLRQRQQLWNHWRREFRDQFPTFQEFMEAFEGGGQRREEPQFDEELRPDEREQARREQDKPRPPPPRPPRPPPPPDPQREAFITACRALGLPESGDFTLKELTTRYRLCISKAHPDRAGHNGAATSLNVARDLIKQAKGWT